LLNPNYMFLADNLVAVNHSNVSWIELSHGWRLMRDDEVLIGGAELSGADAPESGIAVKHMPATILRAMSDAGLTGDLAVGDALTRVERDLWQHDWWYRTIFNVPTGHQRYALVFDGITYRAELWVNGTCVAGTDELVGTYRRFEIDVTKFVTQGAENVLAIRVVPERRTPGLIVGDVTQEGEPTGVDLTDTWADWINLVHHGDISTRSSFLPDKSSGIVQKVWLAPSGQVTLRYPYVRTDLPLPLISQADLTIQVIATNTADSPVTGLLRAHITRDGMVTIEVETEVSLAPAESREIYLSPETHAALRVDDPELWWPYTWGEPTLHHLQLEFETSSGVTDKAGCDFGIRTITGHRDDTAMRPEFEDPNSFYIKINGRDYLVRGAGYTPELLLTQDRERARNTLRYAMDLGINLIRWEGHFIDDGLLELADRAGMPTMFGLMCCGSWERWGMWDGEDHQVAQASVRDSIYRLRSHASIAIWANASDGMPPEKVLEGYRSTLEEAGWQNAVINTASTANRDWSGVHMSGPYAWRSPAFWFDSDNINAKGSVLEEGNNETIPILSTMEKFLPEDARWPFNKMWAMRTGSAPGNNSLEGIKRVIAERYGEAQDLPEFVSKAQLAQYESARALFEAYGALGWRTHEMTVYWMLNSAWPSFFGQLFDHYFGAGGAYFGAKKGLQPVSAVFDCFATGDRSRGYVTLANHSTQALHDTMVTARVYGLDGTLLHSCETVVKTCDPTTAKEVLNIPKPAAEHVTFFVRLTATAQNATIRAENTYWCSAVDDVPDLRVIEGVFDAMRVRQTQWADFTALADMPQVILESQVEEVDVPEASAPSGENVMRKFRITLHNSSSNIAFFVRVELHDSDKQEILPITYSDNYVTIYPGEAVEVEAACERDRFEGTPVLSVISTFQAKPVS
jgi:exo-1,4-beta-D-glucosaminidase